MGLSSIGKKIDHWIGIIGSIGHSARDRSEIKTLKSILTITLLVVIINLLYFCYRYQLMGRDKIALSLLIYAAFFAVNLILFSIHKNFRIIREISFIGIYCYIITYHYLLGGYIGSTGYIDYGVAVLVGVHIFYDKGQKLLWFFTYIITAIILYFLEPVISKGVEPLPDSFRLLAFVNDFIMLAGMIFLSIRFFTKKIREEKAKSDSLIHNILPQSVVDELKIKGRSDPILVKQATTMFMDFVNFTQVTKGMAPQKLVSNLNEHFIHFDQILYEHKVEKLKTIGDGYMAVGGLPDPNNTHPIDVALSAMEILQYLEEWNRDKETHWNLRIGIHTGPMVAGIIGKSKFSYDVWGSSVNLSSRLETSSRPNCINVSEEFMEYTNEFFEFEPRGLIEIKNLGPTRMYFLIDIKDELKSAPYTPNNLFHQRYEKYAKVSFDERIQINLNDSTLT